MKSPFLVLLLHHFGARALLFARCPDCAVARQLEQVFVFCFSVNSISSNSNEKPSLSINTKHQYPGQKHTKSSRNLPLAKKMRINFHLTGGIAEQLHSVVFGMVKTNSLSATHKSRPATGLELPAALNHFLSSCSHLGTLLPAAAPLEEPAFGCPALDEAPNVSTSCLMHA